MQCVEGFRVLAIGGVLASIGFAGVARAESIDGRFRLGLEGEALAYYATTFDYPGAGYTSKEVMVGFGQLPFGPVIGYGLTEHLLLGAGASLSYQTFDVDAEGFDTQKTSKIGVNGRLEYVFGEPDSAVRPFLGPVLGIDYVHSGRGDLDSGRTSFGIAGMAGVHAFIGSSVSIDPSLAFGYETGSYSTPNNDVDLHDFFIGLRVALSAWLGDGPAPAPPRYSAPPQVYPTPTWTQPAYQQPYPSYAPAPAPQQGPAYAPPQSAPPTYGGPQNAQPPGAPPTGAFPAR
jgi:hypothetical protein